MKLQIPSVLKSFLITALFLFLLIFIFTGRVSAAAITSNFDPMLTYDIKEDTTVPGVFVMVMDSAPTANVTITPSVILSGVGVVTDQVIFTPATLTFTPTNWNVPQNFTYLPVNDTLVEGNIVYNIQFLQTSTDTNSDTTTNPAAKENRAAITVIDDDMKVVFTTASLTIPETGGTATVAAQLNVNTFMLKFDGVITTDNPCVTVAPTTANYTDTTWNINQTLTVTVNASCDNLIDDATDRIVKVRVTGAATSSFDWRGIYSEFNVTLTDNDTAGFTVTPTTLTMAENAGTGTYTVVLTSQPATNVVISNTSGSVVDGTVSPATLTFTPANWNVAQTVTVTGVNDNVDTVANDTSTITVSIVDASSDDLFDPLADKTVVATFTDDDTAGITVDTSNILMPENGGTGTFKVKLNSMPATNVVLKVTSASVADGTVSPATLTFTSANWNVDQTVTVTAVNDSIDTATNDSSLISVSVDDPNSDDVYDPLADVTVNATFTDDDTAGYTVSATTLTVGENAGTGTFTVVLTSQPTSNVVISAVSSSVVDGTVSPAALTFTSANWNVAQTVTVTGVDDSVDTVVNDTANVTLSIVDASSDNQFDPLVDKVVAVTFTDDDSASIIVTPVTLTIPENAGTGTFTVKLGAAPATNVVLNVTSASIADGTVSPATLTFTPANYNVAQTVTVTAVNDLIDTATNDSSVITIAVDDANSDNSYDPVVDSTVTATFTDDDTAGITASATTLTVGENAGTGTFTVMLNSQPASNVVLSVVSNSVTEGTVSPATLTFTSANWNVAQTVTVTGVNDYTDSVANDTANVTISVVDASSDNQYDPLADKVVAVTYTDDDTAAYTVSATTLTVGENAGTGTFTVVLNTQPTSNVVMSVTSSAVTEGTVAPATLTFTNANWNVPQTVTVTGVNDSVDTPANDTANVVVSIVDASSDDTFDALVDKTVAVTFTDDDILDTDGDGIPNATDPDDDGDGIPDATDSDQDGDGTLNIFDTDTDGDGIPNATDTDDDGDGTPDATDTTPTGPGSLTDFDGDGIPNDSDADMDNDGINNIYDTDTDGDGIPNATDTDDDNDGILDATDTTPTGLGTLVDVDGDGIVNVFDTDTDGDGTPNATDTDDDNDGILDTTDTTPTGLGTINDIDGDGTLNDLDTDMDGDGTVNGSDTDSNGNGILDKDEVKVDVKITDPYKCGGTIFGEVVDGTKPYSVIVRLVPEGSTTPKYTFMPTVGTDGKWVITLNYTDNTNQYYVAAGKYTVKYFVTDAKLSTDSGEYTADIKNTCTTLPDTGARMDYMLMIGLTMMVVAYGVKRKYLV